VKKKLIFIGAGGHAKSCLEVVKNCKKKYKFLGCIEKSKKINNKQFKNLRIIGYEKDIIKIKKKFKCNNILITIGQINSPIQRKKVFLNLKKKGFQFPIIIAKNSHVAKDCDIGKGTIIMQKVIVNSNVRIGENCIINTGSIIEHDVEIGNNCHIAPGAIINGGAIIKSDSFIGSGAVIKQYSLIKEKTFVQAGSFYAKK